MKKLYSSDEKKKYERGINKICNWLWDEYNVYVDFCNCNSNEYSYEDKIIYIRSRENYRSQLYTLLHEAGHAIVACNKRIYRRNFPHSIRFKKKGEKINIKTKIDTLREEIYAWEKGLEISKILNIRLNKGFYKKHMEQFLWEYVKWAYETNNRT